MSRFARRMVNLCSCSCLQNLIDAKVTFGGCALNNTKYTEPEAPL